MIKKPSIKWFRTLNLAQKSLYIFSVFIIVGSFSGCGSMEDQPNQNELSSFAHDTHGRWVAKHGLTSSQYQAKFDQYVRNGYTLHNISGYAVGGKPRFAAIWDKTNYGAWVARHNLSSNQYQQEFNRLTRAGYRLTDISGYADGNNSRFAALWVKTSGPKFITHHNMTPATYQQKFDAYTSTGYVPVNISAYNVGGKTKFTAIWHKKRSPAWLARHGLSSSAYQTLFDSMVDRGYRLVDVSGYEHRGSTRFAALFVKKSGASWVSHHNMSSSTYQQKFNQYTDAGYGLTHVAGYSVAGKTKYVAIWEK